MSSAYGQRLRYNFITGTIQSLNGTTLTFTNGQAPTGISVTSGVSYVPLIINPTSYGATNTSEIVWIYSYAGGNSAQVARGQEGTTTITGFVGGTTYAHGPTALDFGVVNQIANNDLPAPTNSYYLVGSGTTNVVWTPYASGSTISGAITGPGSTISGNQVSGIVATASNANYAGVVSGSIGSSVVLPTSQLDGTMANKLVATTVTGTTVNVGNTLNVGNAVNVAGEIYANNTGTAISAPNGGIITGGTLQAVTITGTSLAVTSTLTAATITGTTGNIGSGGLSVAGGTNFYNNIGLNGNSINSIAQITATTITGTTLNIVGNGTINGNLTVNGTINATVQGIISNANYAGVVSGSIGGSVVVPASQINGTTATILVATTHSGTNANIANLTTTSGLQVNNNATVNGTLTAATLSVTNNATIGGTLQAVTITGTSLAVTSTLTAATITGTTGNIGSGGLSVTGGTNFYNNVVLNGNSINSIAQITATTITGTTGNIGGGGLNVTGGTNFYNNVGLNGNNVNSVGTLNATTVQATTHSGTSVNVTGNVVANGNIVASGTSSGFTSYAASGNTGFYTQFGNAVIGGSVQATTVTGTTLNVGGNAIVNGNLTVNGTINATVQGIITNANYAGVVSGSIGSGVVVPASQIDATTATKLVATTHSGTSATIANLTTTSGLQVNNNATVNGTLTAATLSVTNNATIGGTLQAVTITGTNLNLVNTVTATTITGTTVSIGNTLNVGNNINSAGTINANLAGTAINAPNGNVIIGGTLQATTITGTTANITGAINYATISGGQITTGSNAQTGNYTVVPADASNIVFLNANAATQTVTLPSGNASTTGFTSGQQITFVRWSNNPSGVFTISGAGNSTNGQVLSNATTSNAPKLRASYSAATALYVNNGGQYYWVVTGDIV